MNCFSSQNYFFLLISLSLVGLSTQQAKPPPLPRWEGVTRFTATNGWPCATPCVKHRTHNYYWCYTQEMRADWMDSHGSWSHCSPTPLTDFEGNECRTECKEHSHLGYFYCYTDAQRKRWNYCGPTLDGPEQTVVAKYKTRFGDYCVTGCERAGYWPPSHSNSWCLKEGGGWEYCSINSGFDVNGRRCNNTCDYHGETYTWCELEGGGWNYCGTVTFDSRVEFTYLGSKCVTPCKLKPDSVDTTCVDATRQERACSISAGVTGNSRDCIGACKTSDGHGESKSEFFNWCWTNQEKTEWEYCSIVKDELSEQTRRQIPKWWNKREYFPKSGVKVQLTRGRLQENIFRLKDGQGNNEVTFFEKLPRSGRDKQYSIKGSEEMRQWFVDCLHNWKRLNYSISSEQGSRRLSVAGSERNGVRLEQQSRFRDENREEFLNLQMLVNGLTKRMNAGRSTIIAEVSAPVKLVKSDPDEIIGAMMISLHEGFAVHVGKFTYYEAGRNRAKGNKGRLVAEEQLV